MTTAPSTHTPDEAAVRDHLYELRGEYSIMVDIAVYGVCTNRMEISDLPDAFAEPSDPDARFAAYGQLERLLDVSGARRAFYAERGQYPVEPVCPTWCTAGEHGTAEPPSAVIFHEHELPDGIAFSPSARSAFSIIAEQTQTGTTEPLLSIDLPNGDENDRLPTYSARLYARALLAAADEFDELTR